MEIKPAVQGVSQGIRPAGLSFCFLDLGFKRTEMCVLHAWDMDECFHGSQEGLSGEFSAGDSQPQPKLQQGNRGCPAEGFLS